MSLKMLLYVVRYRLILLKEWIYKANFPMIFFIIFISLISVTYIVKTRFSTYLTFSEGQYLDFIYICSIGLLASMIALAFRREASVSD
jgi:hypothetical protein